jgi:hypothetical protein
MFRRFNPADRNKLVDLVKRLGAVRRGAPVGERNRGINIILEKETLTLRKFFIVGWAVPTKHQ